MASNHPKTSGPQELISTRFKMEKIIFVNGDKSLRTLPEDLRSQLQFSISVSGKNIPSCLIPASQGWTTDSNDGQLVSFVLRGTSKILKAAEFSYTSMRFVVVQQDDGQNLASGQPVIIVPVANSLEKAEDVQKIHSGVSNWCVWNPQWRVVDIFNHGIIRVERIPVAFMDVLRNSERRSRDGSYVQGAHAGNTAGRTGRAVDTAVFQSSAMVSDDHSRFGQSVTVGDSNDSKESEERSRKRHNSSDEDDQMASNKRCSHRTVQESRRSSARSRASQRKSIPDDSVIYLSEDGREIELRQHAKAAYDRCCEIWDEQRILEDYAPFVTEGSMWSQLSNLANAARSRGHGYDATKRAVVQAQHYRLTHSGSRRSTGDAVQMKPTHTDLSNALKSIELGGPPSSETLQQKLKPDNFAVGPSGFICRSSDISIQSTKSSSSSSPTGSVQDVPATSIETVHPEIVEDSDSNQGDDNPTAIGRSPTDIHAVRSSADNTASHMGHENRAQRTAPAPVPEVQETALEIAQEIKSEPRPDATFVFKKGLDDLNPRRCNIKDCNSAAKLFGNLLIHGAATLDTVVLRAQIAETPEHLMLLRGNETDFDKLMESVRRAMDGTDGALEIFVTAVTWD